MISYYMFIFDSIAAWFQTLGTPTDAKN